MTTNVIPIEPFEAEHAIKVIGGKTRWEPCTVVGVVYSGPHEYGNFLVIRENEDGTLFVDGADNVRKV